MTEKRIKYAIDKETGNPCLAEYSERVKKDKGKRSFECPNCNKEVVLNKGEQKIHYFSHKPMNEDTNKCDFYENYFNPNICFYSKNKRQYDDLLSRKTALILQSILKGELQGNFKIDFVECCDGEQGCKNVYYLDMSYNKMNTDYVLEYKYTNKDGLKMKFDLAKITDGELEAVFEIKDTHPTNEENRLGINCVWLDISAYDLIKLENYTTIQSSELIELTIYSTRKFWKCEICRSKHEAELKRLHLINCENERIKEAELEKQNYISQLKEAIKNNNTCNKCRIQNVITLTEKGLFCKNCKKYCNCEVCSKFFNNRNKNCLIK